MEYLRKGRRKEQLRILIYISWIFVCSMIAVAASSSLPSSQPLSLLLTSSSPSPSSTSSSSSSTLSSTSSASSPLQPLSSSTISPQSPSLSSTLIRELQLNETATTITQWPPSLSSNSSSPSTLQAPKAESLISPTAASSTIPTTLETSTGDTTTSSSSPKTATSAATTTSLTTTTTTTTLTPRLLQNRTRKVCPGVDIRNDLKSFEQLRGCDIIDGSLTIALVSNPTRPYEPKDYENITFPQLTEITGYLLFFRVQGLSTLSRLFPNLAVIRGKELVSNYALIIYEMMHLQKIHLPQLTDILSGSVRIESNPNLCYVSTVNWEGICKHIFAPHFIKDNNARCDNRCPDHCRPWNANSNIADTTTKLLGDITKLGSEGNESLFCWSNLACQELCQTHNATLPLAPNGGCCSSKCAGGCFKENDPRQCYACRSVLQNNTCVDSCHSGFHEYRGTCISKEQCKETIETSYEQCTSTPNSIKVFKPINGRCLASCPNGFEENPDDKSRCEPCADKKCRKVCPESVSERGKPFMVTSVDSLRDLSGCNEFNGSIEISMKGGRNILYELETAFKDLEVITGYLKITRSNSILTLGFLRNLRAINGSALDRDKYSLIIIDNPNLQELFMFNTTTTTSDSNSKALIISKGSLFVHLNPKLCPDKINRLKEYAQVGYWDNESDVSLVTNGDKEACNSTTIHIEVKYGHSRGATIEFENFARTMDDTRNLLYYLVNYREVPNGTVTMFDGRDGCNSQNDKWLTIEESLGNKDPRSSENRLVYLIALKPATRYAVYVKTFMIRANIGGAISEIIYFETAPDTPGMPRQIDSSADRHDSVTVSWLPPSKPNGIIERYLITITRNAELEDLANMDICYSIDSRDKITQSLTKTEPSTFNYEASKSRQNHQDPNLNVNNNNNNNDNSPQTSNTCSKTSSDRDPDIQVEVVTFQDQIIDIVYLKHPCPTSNKTTKRKRSLLVVNDLESELENLMLLQPTRQLTKRNGIDTSSSSSMNYIANDRTSIVDIGSFKNLSQQHKLENVIKFNSKEGRIEKNITALKSSADTRLVYRIENLEHFSHYTIEVVACHGDVRLDKFKTSKTYSKCGLQAITQVRTLPIENNDRILRSSILFNPANETNGNRHTVTWDRPKSPNGLILAYRVRYRLRSSQSEFWTEGCMNTTTYNRDGGFVLSDVNPGTYVFSVQTISTYSDGPGKKLWSEEIEFEIPSDDLLPLWGKILFIISGLLLLMICVATATYYHQKRQHELVYASVNPDYIQYDPDEWEVDKKNLIIGAQIGTGSFGMVYKGQLITEKGISNCAIKTVPPTSTAKQRMDFLREASIMKQFDTYHVIKLLGVVSATTPVYVVMEYMENGDLKEFLRGQREIHQKEKKTLVDGIYLMAAQIADGMAYLASRKFIHRDLAARNCMVGENRVVKIGDFGLTRDVYANDYYRRDTQGRLPVRWMAPESLSDNMYTSASDVWSYGIVVWEMVTFSAYPYQGLSNDEVIKRVVNGFTMPRPDNCPDKLFNIMERCWRRNDRDRPAFNEIIEYLLPETEGKLIPNCFYKKPKIEGDSIAQSIPDEHNNTGTESYPLLSWPSSRANGLTNGVNHIDRSSEPEEQDHFQ